MMFAPGAVAVLTAMAARHVALLAPALQTSLRKEVRNARVREIAANLYADMKTTRAAFAIGADLANLSAYAGTVRGDALSAIIALNLGRPISPRQIVNILDGSRSPLTRPEMQ